MNKIINYINILLVLSLVSCASYSEFNQNNLIPDCEIILSNLHSLINSKNIKINKNVYAAIDFCFMKFKTKELGININNSISKDIYGGMQFQYSTNKSSLPKILISPYMINLYKTKPSIVLSALVHEMQHAKSYFDNTDFFIAMFSSDLEKYFYEMDAYNIEANFIKNYLINNKYSLSKYEMFLLKSYEEDNLANFSFNLRGFDMDLAFNLNKIYKKPISYESKIQLINKIISDLLVVEFKNEGSDWDKFKQVVPFYTAIKFAPQAIRNIEITHNKISDNNKYHMKNQNPELYETLLKLSSKVEILSKYYIKYLEKTQELFKQI